MSLVDPLLTVEHRKPGVQRKATQINGFIVGSELSIMLDLTATVSLSDTFL